MRHNQITMIAPLDRDQRQSVDALLIEEIGYQRAERPGNALLRRVPQLHFMSMFTFIAPGGGGNPEGYLVLEANFDGPVDDFLDEFTSQLGELLGRIFAYCGRRPGEELSQFIRRHSYRPECFYVSCPGLARPQIEVQDQLVRQLQAEADNLVSAGPAACRDYETVFEHMRCAAKNGGFLKMPLVRDPLLMRYGQEIIMVLGVLTTLALTVLCLLALGRWPPLEEIERRPLSAAILGLVILGVAYRLASRGSGILASGVMLLGLLASTAGAVAVSRAVPAEVFMASRFALIGLAVVVGAVGLALYQIDFLERVDSIDTGWINVDHMRDVCRDENSPGCMQNHFINICVVKPGELRLWTLRLMLGFVHLAGIAYFNRGKLGGIPSIHFARWIILDKKEFGLTLLLFLTNYDGSWDSYLGDFVDEASEGVSGIWSNTGGFPRTWGVIIGGGSRFEKQFKAYARKGQKRSLAWFSAYPNVSVAQKLSNAAVRRALDANRGKIKNDEQDELLRRL
jgi:hypothetical protein